MCRALAIDSGAHGTRPAALGRTNGNSGRSSFRAERRRRAGAGKQRADEESPSFGSGPGPPVGTIMGLTTEVTEDTENNKTAKTCWSFLRDLCDLGGYTDRPASAEQAHPPVGTSAIPR